MTNELYCEMINRYHCESKVFKIPQDEDASIEDVGQYLAHEINQYRRMYASDGIQVVKYDIVTLPNCNDHLIIIFTLEHI